VIAVLPDNFAQLLLGSAVAAGSVLIAVSSLWAVFRRHRAEEHFLTLLTTSLRKTFTPDEKVVLQHAQEGELTEKEKEDLRGVIFGTLPKLDPADKDFIQKALKQPSPRGRDNYERKILSKSARQALANPEETNPAGQDGSTADRRAEVQPSVEAGAAQQEHVVPNGIRTRENVARMASDHPTLAAYRTAVREMKNLPDSDPRSWRQQALIYFNSSPHSNWYFLPWQREYLLQFEQICRDLSGDQNFALPYWNWTQNRSIPAPFWEDTLRDGTRQIGPDDEIPAEYVGPLVIDSILRQSEFELFASLQSFGQNNTDPSWQRSKGAKGLLEATPHDRVHVWIGGQMATFVSPLDPIFWLHHCNIDRLWAEWNARGHSNTSEPLWRNFTMRPFNTLVRDLQSITQLGYTYSSLANTQPAEASELPLGLEKTRERFKLTEPQVASLGQAVSFSVEMPGSSLALAAEGKSVQPAAEIGEQQVRAIVSVEPPEDEQVAVNVYLNCPYLTANTPVTDPHYVDSFTFFGEHEAEGEPDSKSMFALDLTETLNRLRALEPESEPQLTIQFMPVALEGRDVPPQEIRIEGVEIIYSTLRSRSL